MPTAEYGLEKEEDVLSILGEGGTSEDGAANAERLRDTCRLERSTTGATNDVPMGEPEALYTVANRSRPDEDTVGSADAGGIVKGERADEDEEGLRARAFGAFNTMVALPVSRN
jgi:hypothetical protein